MSIKSAKNKLRDAKKDLEEMKSVKGNHEEFDRKLSHFLSDSRDALDHLDPSGENHEIDDWDDQKQREYNIWYQTLKNVGKARLTTTTVTSFSGFTKLTSPTNTTTQLKKYIRTPLRGLNRYLT